MIDTTLPPPPSYSSFPCPICAKKMIVVGQDKKRRHKITSCNHQFHFAKTKSQKLMDRQYISHPWGLEKIES